MRLLIATWGLFMVAALFHCNPARAEVMFEAGAGASVYGNDTSTEPTYKVNAGVKGFPIYGTVGYENPKQKVLGQPISDLGLTTLGVGAGYGFHQNFWVAMELGKVWTDVNANQVVVDEVVYTQLVNNHAVPGRSIPINPRTYESSYSVDDGLSATFVVGYQLFPHVAVTGSYRFLQLDQEISGTDPESGKQWREDTTADLNSFTVGVWYTW